MNQRQNLPSEATYAQCGRQHFHPTFAVAISAGSMISAWPGGSGTVQREKAESQMSTRKNKPPLWKVRESKRLIFTLWPLGISSAAGGKEPCSPQKVGEGGVTCSHRCP